MKREDMVNIKFFIFALSLSVTGFTQEVYQTGGPAYGEKTCRGVLSQSSSSDLVLIDFNSISDVSDLYRNLLIAAQTAKSPDGENLSEANLREVMYSLTNFNLYSLPQETLELGIALMKNHKERQWRIGLNLEEALTYALFKFTFHHARYLRSTAESMKEAELVIMKEQINILSKYPNANGSRKLKWFLASMNFVIGERDKSLEILLSVFRSTPFPSQTLITAIEDLSKLMGVQLSNSILAKVVQHRSLKYRVYFDVAKQWGPYVTRDYERLAFESQSN